MALEGKWGQVGPIDIILPSPGFGIVRPENTALFKIGMIVVLSSSIRSDNYKVVDVTKTAITVVTLVGNSKVDMGDFDPSNSGTITAYEQAKIIVAEDDQDTDRWEKGPTNADRNVLVDQWGDFFSVENPLPVQLSNGQINIGTVNAQLETFLTHKDNDPDPGDVHSSIRIGDGEHVLNINPDGSINVNTGTVSSIVRTVFDEASVVAGVTEVVLEWTASVDCKLQKIAYSGENCAEWTLIVDGNTVDKARTWFGNFNGSFDFLSGIDVFAGQKVEVSVFNFRQSEANFNARIQYLEA